MSSERERNQAEAEKLADGIEQDLVLGAEDVDEVIDDDGDDEFVDEAGDEADPAAEPLIKDEPGEPKEKPDNAIAGTFLHKPGSAMFALALHPQFPNPPLAVSGGQDDMGHLFCPLPRAEGSFTRETFPPIALTGHTDSVVAASFSADGEYVATGGMDGRVRVWRHARPKRGPAASAAEGSADAWKYWEFITSLEAGEVSWLRWHPKGPVLAAGCEDASVWLWNLPSGRTMTVLSAHTMECTAGVFPPPAGRQLLTTSLDSSLILWNPSTPSPELKMSIFCPPNAREMDPSVTGITALAVSPNGALAAVGSASGRIRLVAFARGEVVDTKAEVVQTLDGGHARGESIESLAFIDLLQGAAGGKGLVVVSAGTDGRCVVWDSTTGRIRAEMRHPEAITSMAPHPAPCQYLVTTACGDRTLRTWDIRTGTLLAEHYGHAGVVNCVAVAPALQGDTSPLGLPQAQFIISGGDEGASLLWRI